MITHPLKITKGALVLGVLFLVIPILACSSSSTPTSTPAQPTLTSPAAAATTVPTRPSDATATRAIGAAPIDDLVTAGRDLFSGGGGCSACHTIDGAAQGVLGPDQTHVGTWAVNRIPGYTAEEYIRESIREPCAYNVSPQDEGIDAEYQCLLMEATVSAIPLSDAEIDALVAFLLAQK